MATRRAGGIQDFITGQLRTGTQPQTVGGRINAGDGLMQDCQVGLLEPVFRQNWNCRNFVVLPL